MFENKKVQKTVQKLEVDEAEVNKAVRDFNAKNQDCDVLVFVSEDIAISPIASIILTLLTKVGDRPAIWIGEFYFKRRQSRLSGTGGKSCPRARPLAKKTPKINLKVEMRLSTTRIKSTTLSSYSI